MAHLPPFIRTDAHYIEIGRCRATQLFIHVFYLNVYLVDLRFFIDKGSLEFAIQCCAFGGSNDVTDSNGV